MNDSEVLSNCAICGEPFKSVLRHIARSKECHEKYYPPEKLKELKEGSSTIAKRKRKLRDETPDAKEAKSVANKSYYQNHKKQRQDYHQAYYQKHKSTITTSYKAKTKCLQNFYKEIQFGPIFPCVCCIRCLPSRTVHKVTENFKKKLITNGMIQYVCLEEKLQVNGLHYICGTCYSNLAKESLPSQCFQNGLKVAEVPVCLKVSDLGNQLLAKNLIFIKVSCQMSKKSTYLHN